MWFVSRDGGSVSVNIGIFWSIGWIEKYSIGISKNNIDPASPVEMRIGIGKYRYFFGVLLSVSVLVSVSVGLKNTVSVSVKIIPIPHLYLTVHYRKHTRDILSCSHLYETPYKGSISAHMRKHTENMLKCPYWDNEITQTDRLNSHLSQHVKNMFKWILLRPRLLKSHLYVGRNQKFTKKVDDKKKFLQELKKIFFLLESLWIF